MHATIERKRLHGYTQAMSAALQQARKMIAESGYTDAARFVPRTYTRTRRKLQSYVEGNDDIGNWPIEIREAMKRCNLRQVKFSILLALQWSQLDAYLAAYDRELGDVAGQRACACEIAANPNVSYLVAVLANWISTKWLADATAAKDYGLTTVYEIAETAVKDETRLAAATTILKAAGAFVNRSEITHIHEAGNTGIESSIGALLGAAMAAAVPVLPTAAVIDVTPDSPIGDSITLSIEPSPTE